MPPTNPTAAVKSQALESEPPKQATAPELYGEFFALIVEENPLTKVADLRSLVSRLLKVIMTTSSVTSKYNWLVIHDPLTMTRPDADKIYKAISTFDKKKDIALTVTSGGGQIEPAYLISKLCREMTSGRFVAIVPRRAKSGATLICCGADEIHMGQMSELGPIDPQLDKLPALGLKNAVQHLAELASQYPKASDMFAKYLADSLDLVNLGYYERVAESAVQYAERLLRRRISPLKSDPRQVAEHLVYGYKDHGFVIDRMEAEAIFGPAMVKGGTPEYDLGNMIYEWLSLIERACDSVGYNFYLYGTPDSECNFVKKR